MKMEVWKYPIVKHGNSEIRMPHHSKILCFQLQDDIPTIWVLVDSDVMLFEYRRFQVVNTGEPLGSAYVTYIGTIQDGGYVAHLFENT